MSETDDTDELLLVPPDLYTRSPELERRDKLFLPYYNIVDSLITQIGSLEDRLSLIETTSEGSPVAMQKFRKYNSSEDLLYSQRSGPTESTQSTPQKPRSKFTLSSLPSSPNTDSIKLKKSFLRKPEINPMLGEIDSFISNVKLIKRLNAARNLDAEFDTAKTLNLELEEVDVMLKDMEMKEKRVEERLKQKEMEYEKPFVKEKTWQPGDNIGSVPDYGYGMRRLLYTDKPQGSESKATYKKLDSVENGKSESNSSVESQVTTCENLKLKAKMGDLEMVSLAKLWNAGGGSHQQDDSQDAGAKFQQKLQEEQLRRQHCEQAIQKLQNRILELQERVTVAVQVDEAKDKAIWRFSEYYEKASAKVTEVEKERDRLLEEVSRLSKKNAEVTEETSQKLEHYEREASKALHIAQVTQDKMQSFEQRCSELQLELEDVRKNCSELQKRYAAEVEKNKQYPEIIAMKEIELNENKNVLSDARKEVAQSKRAVEICQEELTSLTTECENLQSRLQDERNLVVKLREQKAMLEDEVNAKRHVEKGLQEELTKAKSQIDKTKMELKNFYQGQVELVVQNKLKEFQNQLDQAEKALRDELSRKEMAIAKTAANHIQQISEKFTLEIKLLEEKHQEQCRLYQVQYQQAQQAAEEATYRLKRHKDRQGHIERQLFKFMDSLRQDNVTTVDEVNSFRSKSFNNLEEILSLNLTEENEKTSRKDVEEDKNSQGTYRLGETPRRNALEDAGKSMRRRDQCLQQTIEMLLAKKPDDAKLEEPSQSGRDGGLLYHRNRGKPPWK